MELKDIESAVKSTIHIHASYILIVIALICTMIFGYNSYNSKSKELESLKKTLTVQAELADTQTILDNLKQQQADLVSQLTSQLNTKQNLENQLIELRKQIKLTPKKDIENEINKMSDDQLISLFRNAGYNATLIR